MKAFPNEFESAGMDLRDYFAAKAMQAVLGDNYADTYAHLAKVSYMAADAMMEARKQ